MQALALKASQMGIMSAEQRHTEAQRLAGLWSRISRQHLSSGQGCACGFGGGLILQGASFELDIIEFVLEDAKKQGFHQIGPFIDATCKRGPDRYSLPDLLDAVATPHASAQISAKELNFILTKLAMVLSSMDEAHNRRFACD